MNGGEKMVCSLSSKGFILNAYVPVGGGLLDKCIVKMLLRSALSLLQMLNVHFALIIL